MAARLPSKLPDADALGSLPSARTGRHIAKLDIDAYGARGRGMASIGQALAGIGGSISEAEDRNEALDVQQRLLELEQQSNRDLDERRRTLTGDPAGFADSTRSTFTESGREAFNRAREAGLSERGLQRLARGMAGIREGLHSRAFTHELNQRGHYGEDWAARRVDELRNDYLRAPDDESRERIFRDAETTVQHGRERYGFGHEAERRLRTGVERMLEDDALARPDSYAALLELREGDRRLAMPSTGEISELGLSRLEAASRQPGMSPAQVREAQGRLRTEAGALSKLIQSEVREGVALNQAQHDALVSFGVVRGRDALQELLPLVNSEGPGREAALSQAMRTKGGLTTQEQPSLADVAREPGPVSPIEVRPVPGGRVPAGAGPRRGNVEGIVLHHTSGTTLEGALSQNQFARTGYNYYIDRDGTPYVFAPDNQRMSHVMPPGHRDRIPGAWPNLSSENTIGISVVAQNDGDMTDAQRNTLRSLTTQLATQHGIDPQNIIGHGDIQHTRQPNEGSLSREFRDGSRRVAQRAGTMTDAGPARPSTPAGPNVDEYADLIEGRGTSSRYSRLPAERRRVLIGKMEQALRPAIMADMDDDIETIRQSGQPRRLPDGSTSFTRAARILTPNQFERYQLRMQEAQSQYRALHGLQDMTPDQVGQRREQLSPSRNAGERFSTLNRTRTMFDTAVERLQEEGQRDPAQSVEGGIPLRRIGTQRRETMGPDGNPVLSNETDIDHRLAPAREVAEAHALVRRRHDGRLLNIGTSENGDLVIQPVDNGPEAARAQQEAWRIIIDARMDAQARRGIPERFRAPITRAEAEDLLNMPRRITDDTEFRRLMGAAVDRAYERYGPHARQALDAAIRFRSNLSKEEADVAGSMVRDMVQGVGTRAEELDRLSRSLRLSREQRAWLGGGDVEMEGVGTFRVPGGPQPRAPEPQRNMWQRMTGGGAPQPDFSRYTAPQASQTIPRAAGPGTSVAWPKPPPNEVQYLVQNPQIWREFAKDYGLETTRQILQGIPRP